MKNKLFKAVENLILSVFIIMISICSSMKSLAKHEIIESPNGYIFKIDNEVPGRLLYEFHSSIQYKCIFKGIVVTGELNSNDFFAIELAINYGCTFVDLSCAKIDRIPTKSFDFKNNLEEFICPKDLKVIEKECFIECNNLRKFILPKGLECIQEHCFIFCRNLELTIPKEVEIFGEANFPGSPNINYFIENEQIQQNLQKSRDPLHKKKGKGIITLMSKNHCNIT